MLFFNSYRPGSLCKKTTQSVITLFILLCLLTVLPLAGCKIDSDEPENSGFIPVGEWATAFDSYTITETRLEYFMDNSDWGFPDSTLEGDIARAVDFSNTTGVIIIKITEATYNTAGKYTGVYYRDYSGSSVRLATGIGPAPDYAPLEADSLSAALSLFTVDNIDIHVIDWAGIAPYTK